MTSAKICCCSKCGGTAFTANQPVRGSVPVVVSIAEGGVVSFLRNATEDGELDASGLDFDEPEGPFACSKCGEPFVIK